MAMSPDQPELEPAHTIPSSDVIFKTTLSEDGDLDLSADIQDSPEIWARHMRGRLWFGLQPIWTHGNHYEWVTTVRMSFS